jgi:hypothetical protein
MQTRMQGSVREWLTDGKYKRIRHLFERLSDFRVVCTLSCTSLDFEEIVNSIYEIVTRYIHGIQVEIETSWSEWQYQELNLAIEDLRLLESFLKSFPKAFPASWNQGIIEKIEHEIEEKRKKAKALLSNSKTARDSFQVFEINP